METLKNTFLLYWNLFSQFVRLPMQELVLHFFFFSFPIHNMRGSTVGIKFVFKRFYMVIIPLLFELSLSQSKIYFFRVTGCCCIFVYHAFLSAITIKGTICLNSTVNTRESLVFLSEQSFCYAL